MVPWEEFCPVLEKIRQKPKKSNAGRKPLDGILMFKLLILQKLHNISDEELEYQVNDRLSFMQFLGLSLADSVPDATTVWLFRQQLTEDGLVEALFEQFESYLQSHAYQAKGGQILDATIVPVPKQHISKEEKAQLDQGEIPQDWREKPHRLSQRDTDAQWTKKNNVSHFHPLTEQQMENNREKSKTRAKVEHVFGAWVNEMGGKVIHSIGIERARAHLGLRNLAFNLKRYVSLETQAVNAG